MRRNYEWKLLQEIIRRNYYRKLSASIYHHAEKVGFIDILTYPKRFDEFILLYDLMPK